MATSITEIRGIGTNSAETLANHGIKTVKALANATLERIASVPGFSETRASKVKEQALTLLAQKQKTTGKKRTNKRAVESKPNSVVLEKMVEAMDEASKEVSEAVQEASEENMKAAHANHEALEEMVEAMDEAGQDVAESLVKQDAQEQTQPRQAYEPELDQETREAIILERAIPEVKGKEQKLDKRDKRDKKEKKGKKKKEKKKRKKK